MNKFLVNYNDKNITCILFEKPEQNVSELLSKFRNVKVINAEISTSFVDSIKKGDNAILLCKIGQTDADIYKSIKETLQIHNKQILKEVLI